MSSGFPGAPFGGGPFDDFFQAFLGSGAARRGMQRVDITQLLSSSAREVVAAAARQAAEWGSTDLDTEHLLWALAATSRPGRCCSGPGRTPTASGPAWSASCARRSR